MARRFALVALVLAIGTAGCGTRAAPPTDALPLMPGAGVVASASGGSDVDTAYDHEQYRYMAISGPAGLTGHEFLTSEIAFLRNRGWHDASSITRERGNSGWAVPASYTTPGADIGFDSPTHEIHAFLYVIGDAYDAAEDESGSPLPRSPSAPLDGNAAIAYALASHKPVLWIQLGNGRASR